MSVRRPNFQEEASAEAINISPLIDVIFILLIFFIVTMVFADGNALKVDVPKAETASKPDSSPLTVVVRADSSLEVGGERTTLAGLESKIRAHLRKNKGVVLRGESNAPVSALVAALDCAKKCGAEEIFIAADKK